MGLNFGEFCIFVSIMSLIIGAIVGVIKLTFMVSPLAGVAVGILIFAEVWIIGNRNPYRRFQ